MTKNIYDFHLKILNEDQWRKYSFDFQDLSYRHLFGFSKELSKRSGSQVEFLAFFIKNEIVGLSVVRIKSIPFSTTGIAYISGGPLLLKIGKDLSLYHEKILSDILGILINEFVVKRKLTLRILPSLVMDLEWNKRIISIFSKKGFNIQIDNSGYRTIVVDISHSLEEVKNKFISKWRNCLNKALKQDINIIKNSESDNFSIFINLFDEMIQRKDFSVNLHPEFYAKVQKNLDVYESFNVIIAEIDGKPVAGHVSSSLGNTSVYLLGASNEDGLKANAPYLLQWHAIEYAKQRGCMYYDLGGIDPEHNPGVYRFKKRMGGFEITVPGPFEIHPGFLQKAIVKIGESTYRFLSKK